MMENTQDIRGIIIGALALISSNWLLLTYYFNVLIANWYYLNIPDLFKYSGNTSSIGYYQIGIIPIILIQYALIAVYIICARAFIFGGFLKLKDYDSEGMLFCLVWAIPLFIFAAITLIFIGIIYWIVMKIMAFANNQIMIANQIYFTKLIVYSCMMGIGSGALLGIIVGILSESDRRN